MYGLSFNRYNIEINPALAEQWRQPDCIKTHFPPIENLIG